VRDLAASVTVMGTAPDSAIADLPPADTKRWTVQRKAAVVEAVQKGVISLEEACRRYDISIEEFLNWQRLVDAHGIAGLKATQAQRYRRLKPPR
jgi:transposase-like protein